MPRATVSTEIIHRDLKSLPEGFVELKRLPFGGMLKRRDMAGRMYVQAQENGSADAPEEYAMEVMQEASRIYEFHHCIVAHNLEDENGRKLDFTIKNDVLSLDPKVGTEIEGYIDELNRELDEETERNFPESSTDSSKGEETTQPE